MTLFKTILSTFFCLLLVPTVFAKPNNGQEYKIRKGGHFSKLRVQYFKGTEMSMAFQFDESAIYTSKDPSNQGDVNKLWGFSDCNRWEPQHFSARFGWRWLNQRIEIMALVDYEYEHRFVYLGSTQPGEWSTGKIKLEEGKYAFYYKGVRLLMDRDCGKSKFTGFQQYPYFGGDETAPHPVKIRLKKR